MQYMRHCSYVAESPFKLVLKQNEKNLSNVFENNHKEESPELHHILLSSQETGFKRKRHMKVEKKHHHCFLDTNPGIFMRAERKICLIEKRL